MKPIRQVRRTGEEEESNTTVMGDEIRPKLENNMKLTEIKVDIVELTRKNAVFTRVFFGSAVV